MAKEKQIQETEAPDSLNATTKEVVSKKVAKPTPYEVLKPFRNTETKVMQEPGDEITVANESRLKAMFKKGLLLDPTGETKEEGEPAAE